ncbi:MAG: response regulator transcription factor, partial [Stackebrandtia sp.]
FTDTPGAVRLLDKFVGCFGHLDRFVDVIRDCAPPRAHAGAIVLTSTELSVLRHLPSAMTTQSIADDLGVSINTVKTHLRGIYQKLGARSRADAIMTARAAGLI